MPKPVADLYDTLTLTAQQEAYDFMMYLLHKQQNLTETMQKETRKQNSVKSMFLSSGCSTKTLNCPHGVRSIPSISRLYSIRVLQITSIPNS